VVLKNHGKGVARHSSTTIRQAQGRLFDYALRSG
jgi:hypothetical protein